jgi:flagellar protein FlgJ
MDVTTLSGYYLDQVRLTPSAELNRLADSESAASSGATFAELLAAGTGDETSAAVENTPALAGKATIDKTGELYEQCEALETFIVKTLLSGMRKTIEKSEFSDTGFAGEMYEDMLWDEYAKDFTKNSNFGLAELAYLELTGQRGTLLTNPGTVSLSA